MAQIAEILKDRQTFSYEFHPPKNETQVEALQTALGELSATDPDFISITYGALGSTRETTRDIAIAENAHYTFPVMAHLTCEDHSKTDISNLLQEYSVGGLENILALRGDGSQAGEFEHAIDLVEFIKQSYPRMSVGVAAHPEIHPDSTSRPEDRSRLAAKLELADFALTQFFFNPDPYKSLVDELDSLGCTKPVIPGIMLFGSAQGLYRMAGLNNTFLPPELVEQLDTLSKPSDIAKLAVETSVNIVKGLEAYDIPGLHIYTLNKSEPAMELQKAIGWD